MSSGFWNISTFKDHVALAYLIPVRLLLSANFRRESDERSWTVAILTALGLVLVLATASPQASSKSEGGANLPVYLANGDLKFPANYREWVYLTTGIDMSYRTDLMSMDHSMFDNVFVNPEAYKAFMATGTWADKTILVLEARVAGSEASINKKGHFQKGEVMAREVHLKDEARFPRKWAFFDADDGVAGKLLPQEMDCYSCHAQHGALDTTFVQFYPTLLEVAKKKNTLSAVYMKEESEKSAENKK